MEAAVVANSREITRDVVSITRLSGSGKTNNGHHHPHPHHQHHPHLQKPRVPPKHAGLTKSGLSQDPLVLKASSKESMKESSVTLTRLLCGEDGEKRETRGGGEATGNKSQQHHHNNHHHPLLDEATVGGSFSETVSRSPIWGHQTSKVHDSSVIRSRSFSCGNKANVSPVRHNRKEDSYQKKEGVENETTTNKGKATQKAETALDERHQQHQTLNKAPVKSISVRQQWMAKRRSLSNSPKIGVASEPRDHRKSQAVLSESVPVEATCAELLPLTSGMRVGRKKLSVRKDETEHRHRHTEKPYADDGDDGTQASDHKGCVSSATANSVCAGSRDTSQEKAFAESDDCEQVTIISGNLKGSQKGKVVYVDRKHMQSSFSSSLGETVGAGASAGSAESSVPLMLDALASGTQSSNSSSSAHTADCAMVCKDKTTLVKPMDDVRKHTDTSASDLSMVPLEENSSSNKAFAHASKRNNTAINISQEDAHSVSVSCNSKKVSDSKVDLSQKVVCDTEAGDFVVTVKDDIVKKNVCDSEIVKTKIVVCEKQKQYSVADSLSLSNESRQSNEQGVALTDSGIKALVDRVVAKSLTAAPRTKVQEQKNIVADVDISDRKVSSDVNNVNSIEMKTFRESSKDNKSNKTISVTAAPNRSCDKADAKTTVVSATVVVTTTSATTVTVSNASTKTHTATTVSVTSTITSTSTTNSSSCQASVKPASSNSSSSGSEREKVYANEDSLPNSPQNVPEEGTTPTDNIEITDLDFFKTDIVRSSHCKRNGFSTLLGPSNSPKQVREVAVATTPMRDLAELTGLARPPPPPAGRGGVRNACVTIVEVHHQPPAKKHTVDIVPASNARSLDAAPVSSAFMNTFPATTTITNSCNGSISSSIHLASPRAHARPLRETSSSSSSRDSSPEKKGDLAVALTSSQDEKNRVRDLMAAGLQQEEAGKAKAKVKEATAASDAPDRKNASKDLAAAVTSSQDEKNRTMAFVAACSSSSSTSASTSCSSSQSEKKSRGEPILKPKARTKPAKSVSFNNKDVIATATPDNGLHFQLGILKECEVQVQAFLEDADSVLEALDQCQAEEKCLMLIKRPRESAKKMLKSQSWANLSVSDPQLYRQFNGLQVAQVHQPIAQPASLKDKRALNEPPMASREEEEGELSEQHARRRYVNNRDRVISKPQHQRLSLPTDGPLMHSVAGDYSFGSDSSSSCSTVSSDYQYNAPRRERRLEQRYPSIPEDEVQEINNNKGFGTVAGDLGSPRPLPPSTSSSSAVSMYHSYHDVSFVSNAISGVRSEGSFPQGHGNQALGRQYLQHAPQRFGVAGKGSGSMVNPSPQQAAYQHYQQQQQSKGHAHDPGDLNEESRSQSLGNLSTGGLTLSLVGQRNADSMVDLASPTSPPPPAMATQLRPHRPAPRSHRSESYQQDFFPSQHASQHGEATVGSPRHSYPEPHNVRTPRVREDLQAYASPPSSGGGGYYGQGGAVQQSPYRQQDRPQPQHAAGNYPSYAGGMPRSHHHQHQQQKQLSAQHQAAPGLHNGYGDVRVETGFPNGAPPPKPKRNLPHVSLNETSEKIKRFTEIMKSRMSVSSNSSRSSATPHTPNTPLSREPSVTTDNGSDCEVSNLLDSGPGAGDSGSSGSGPGLPHRPFNPASASKDGKAIGEQMVARGHGGLPPTHLPSMMGPHYPHPQQPCSSASYSSSALSEVGGQACFTSHSHSSTLDSGYTTNNECEADSCLSGYPHHPHQKMLSPPNLHQPPKALPSRPPQQQVHLHHLQHHNPPHQAQQQQYPVQSYQPQGQPAEPLRPVPQPRNLSLANARKYSSMQNVHSRPAIAQDPLHPDFYKGENGGQAGPGHLSQGKELSSARAQHSVNGYDGNADHGHHPAVLEHQRRSWDLAQSFKSLDFVPASSGPVSMDSKLAAAMGVAVKGREDTAVIKPMPVSGSSSSGNNSSSSGGSHPCSSAGSSPAHRPDAQRRDTQHRTQRRSSWQEMVRAQEAGEGGGRGSESPPPPLPALPPPALDASGVSSLPGHWKSSNNNTSSNSINNSRPNAVTLQAGSSSNSGSCSGASSSGPSTPQRMPLRLASIDTESGSAVGCTSPTPSLFQLSQLFDMRSLRFKTLPPSSTLAQVLTLTAVPVSLPAGGLDAAASPPAHSPQGRTAKLGGPGSAFRKVGAGAGGQGVVLELTAVAAVLDPSPELWTLGPPLVGDLIVEINGRQCMGWEVARIQESLSATQGDILMGVARKREQQTDGRVQQLEISLKTLEQEVHKMKEELAKKDARILELSTMLPWKREEDDSKDGKLILEQEEGVFVIGENEFVV